MLTAQACPAACREELRLHEENRRREADPETYQEIEENDLDMEWREGESQRDPLREFEAKGAALAWP